MKDRNRYDQDQFYIFKNTERVSGEYNIYPAAAQLYYRLGEEQNINPTAAEPGEFSGTFLQ